MPLLVTWKLPRRFNVIACTTIQQIWCGVGRPTEHRYGQRLVRAGCYDVATGLDMTFLLYTTLDRRAVRTGNCAHNRGGHDKHETRAESRRSTQPGLPVAAVVRRGRGALAAVPAPGQRRQ